MAGPFGGSSLFLDGEHSREHVPATFATSLCDAPSAPLLLAPDGPETPAGAAAVVRYDFDPGGTVRFPASFLGSRSLEEAKLSTAATLAALVSVGRRLAYLHAQGVAHGELCPELVRVDGEGAPLLLLCERRLPPGELLRARLRYGMTGPAAVAFVAPEACTGTEPSPASDVYSLAALVHATMAGYAPLGQLNLPVAQGPLGVLAQHVTYALSQSPAQRPPLDALLAALEHYAAALAAQPALRSPYHSSAGPVSSAAEAQSTREREGETSAVLLLVLAVGGFFAFVGAVMLVAAGWDVVGDAGRVVVLALCSAVLWGAGSLAARKGLPTAATVLRGVGALFGVVSGSYGFYLLGEGGRLAFLALLTAGCLGASGPLLERGSPLGGAALGALGSQLVWAAGGQALHYLGYTDKGSIVALAATVSGITYALALARSSGLLSALVALDFAVFSTLLADWLHRGTPTGPALFLLGVALGYVALAAGLVARKADLAALWLSAGAVCAALASAAAGLFLLESGAGDTLLFAAAWPFFVALVAALLTYSPGAHGRFAGLTALGLLTTAPTLEAMLRHERGYGLLAVGLGLALVCAGFAVPRLARNEGTQSLVLLCGLGGAMATPLWMLSQSPAPEGAFPALSTPVGFALAVLCTVSTVLLMISFAASARGSRRSAWRMLESASLGQFYGVFSLFSLSASHHWCYPVTASAVALALLAAGRATRRLVLVTFSTAALLFVGWSQYFVRLADVLPLSVRLVGFGVGLLLGGVLYEQRIKRELPALREWS